MPKSDDRFYLMAMSNRPAMHGDVGSLLKLEGVVIGGGDSQAVLMLPGTKRLPEIFSWQFLDIQEWSDWLQRSDNPEILVGPVPNGSGATLPKIWHRKLRYEVSGAVQQKVWASDGFECVYCGAKMGDVLMTVDHFIPLELGGVNDITNYLTACKPCNKSKGSQAPEVWLASRPPRKHSSGLDSNFEGIGQYLKARNALWK